MLICNLTSDVADGRWVTRQEWEEMGPRALDKLGNRST